MTPREQEFQRIKLCVDRIFNPTRMLFAILVGDDPQDACMLKYERFENAGGTIPNEYTAAAKSLYRLAGNEFERQYAQHLCRVIEDYLATQMPRAELQEFKKKTPVQYPVERYSSVLEEFLREGLLSRGEYDRIHGKDDKP